MNKNRISALLLIIVGILQILVPVYLLPVCSKTLELVSGNTVPMKCHWYANGVCLMGVILLLQAVIKLWDKCNGAGKSCDLFLIITGMATILLGTDFVIGVCSGTRMACHMGTRPAVNILGAITIVISVADLALHWKKAK